MAGAASTYSPPETMTFVFTKQYDDIKNYPLHDSMGLVIGIVAVYLLLVLKIGPDFMKNREPYKLKNTIIIYNATQVVLSGYFAYLGLEIMWLTGLCPRKCQDHDPAIRNKTSYCIYIYWLGKFTELLDTIFFVLRKKYSQVTFLHVYHHSSVVIGTYLLFLYSQSQSAVYGTFINSLVHVVMYFYYGVAAMGTQNARCLTWKKHITNLQRMQFVSIFLHQVVSIFYTKCEHSILGILYVLSATALFLVLFTNFYIQSYKKTASAVTPSQTGGFDINKEKEQ